MSPSINKLKIFLPIRYFFWLLILSIGVICLLFFVIYIYFEINSKQFISLNNIKDTNILEFVIIIAGFITGISAISMYSVFNSNIDKEKSNLENLTIKVQENTNKLNTLCEDWKKIKNDLSKLITDSSILMQNYPNDKLNMLFLSSPFTTPRKKIEIIFEYQNKDNIKEDIKESLKYYYNKIKDGSEYKSEVFLQELKKLVKEKI